MFIDAVLNAPGLMQRLVYDAVFLLLALKPCLAVQPPSQDRDAAKSRILFSKAPTIIPATRSSTPANSRS